jgi:hypothetical protein
MTREDASKLKTVATVLTTGVSVLIALYGARADGVREVMFEWPRRCRPGDDPRL